MRNSVKVIFKNTKYNYTTSVNDQTTEADARKYFVNTQFDLGVYPNEDLQVCIDIEFNSDNLIKFSERLEMTNLIPVHINKCRCDNYFWNWSSEHKDWIRGEKIPEKLNRMYKLPPKM